MPAKRSKNHGGARPNAGRKKKAVEQGIADLMSESFPMEDRHRVVRALYFKAEEGDSKAAALLFAYTYGKPKESVEHSGEIKSGIPVLNVILSNGKTN